MGYGPIMRIIDLYNIGRSDLTTKGCKSVTVTDPDTQSEDMLLRKSF